MIDRRVLGNRFSEDKMQNGYGHKCNRNGDAVGELGRNRHVGRDEARYNKLRQYGLPDPAKCEASKRYSDLRS